MAAKLLCVHDPSQVRRARIAATVAFATNGALPATLLARYAEVKEHLGVDTAVFGLLVVGLALGGTLAANLPGVILRRLGDRRATVVGTTTIALALTAAAAGATSEATWLFVAGLVLAGFSDAVVDVAQNAQGLRVQAARGASVLSSMHAGWSIGAALGGAIGTVAAMAEIPLVLHLAGWGVLCAASMMTASRAFLPDAVRVAAEDGAGAPRPGWSAVRLLLPLALVALAGFTVEEIGANWSAVLLSTERGVAAASAGIGLTVLLAAQFVGRLLGDRFIDRVGDKAALVASLSAVTAGLVAAAWLPSAAGTVVGLAIAGLGSAITVPLAFAQADALPGLQAHTGVTWIGFSIRVAALGLSPAIGGLSALTSLPLAISAGSLLALTAMLLLARRRI